MSITDRPGTIRPGTDRPQALLQLSPCDRDQLLAALVVGLLLVFPLALKVPLFIDDFGRSLNGSYDWSKDGRPLAELMYRFLMLGSDRVNSDAGLRAL